MSLPCAHRSTITTAQLNRARRYMWSTAGRPGLSLGEIADRLNVDARTLDLALWSNLGRQK